MTGYTPTIENLRNLACSRSMDSEDFDRGIKKIQEDAVASLDAQIRELHAPSSNEHSSVTYCSVCFTDEGLDGAFNVVYPCPTVAILNNAKK